MSQVWFITGCSTGFGKVLVQALLESDAKVVATARNVASLEGFVPRFEGQLLKLALDVTLPQQIEAAVAQAQAAFGRIDVLVNNAGYGMMGALEETQMDALRQMVETNVFGVWQMTKAVLPLMRAQGQGRIVMLSSTAGVVPTAGFCGYNLTKFALEGMSEALALEVAPFGIQVMLVEPGPFRTDFIGRSLAFMPAMPEYATSTGATREYLDAMDGKQPGDPQKAIEIIMEMVAREKMPLHLPLGNLAVERIRGKLAQRQESLNALEKISRSADFE